MSSRSLLPEYTSSVSGPGSASRDWLQAIRTRTNFRIGNSTVRCQTNFTLTIMTLGTLTLLLLYTLLPKGMSLFDDHTHYQNLLKEPAAYNATYPLTKPIALDRFAKILKYRIAVVADMDKESKLLNDTWVSKLKTGWLKFDRTFNTVEVEWDSTELLLKGSLSQAGRGMELSELVVFNGRLLTFDDRTGVIYEIEGDKVIPWVLLNDGDGHATKGFKSEWATVKDSLLYVGGLGKEWTNSKGEVISYDPQWIKVVTPGGRVVHRDWRDNYIRLCSAANIEPPGYMIHEAVNWSPIHQQWFFLPRRASHEAYDDLKDEERGTNLLLRASQDFQKISLQNVGPKIDSHGFSSFKFIPGECFIEKKAFRLNTQESVAVAIKSEEVKGKAATYITVFKVKDGQILHHETKIGNVKYEGIEFI
ncbi:soluble calcium-activated nucleotidase 1-like [Tropilaelaps mercedesae]|uniref:Apyrase n=1 Tax=Tropilaelaps mercedesae TaxID=418985 RepID=A0A1V9X9X3_9ACAR|nr:soluble calcium-activated nucleotidase 1-like [Tropilaelaps mercedesae]